jgi:hypothetical protein
MSTLQLLGRTMSPPLGVSQPLAAHNPSKTESCSHPRLPQLSWKCHILPPQRPESLPGLTSARRVRSLNSRLVYKSKGVNCRGKRKEWELSVPLNVVSSVLWSNYYQRTNKIFNLFKSLPIPCKSCFLCCCLGCPLMDDRKEHFWMGKPGVNVAIILGRQVRQTPPYAKVPISSSFSGEQKDRRHPGRERMGSSTTEALQEPILLLPWVCFRGGGFPFKRDSLSPHGACLRVSRNATQGRLMARVPMCVGVCRRATVPP